MTPDTGATAARVDWTPDLERALSRGTPAGSVEEWKQRAEALLSRQRCVFHRNSQISALYAALYLRRPDLFKWSGLAAIASHHVRLALWPLRLGADPTQGVDLPRALGRWQSLRIADVDRVRQVNNGIFDDIFWAHLVYDATPQGLTDLDRLLKGHRGYDQILGAFTRLEEGRRLLSASHPDADDVIWEANRAILEHEQRALVQPSFDQLSCGFARVFSFGASAGFEVGGLWKATSVLSSFYSHTLRNRMPSAAKRRLPLLTSYDDRWAWIDGAIVPRFRTFEGRKGRLEKTLTAIIDEARRKGAGASTTP